MRNAFSAFLFAFSVICCLQEARAQFPATTSSQDSISTANQDSTTVSTGRITKKNVVIGDDLLLGETYFFHYVPFETKIIKTFHPDFDATGKQHFDKLLRFNNGYYAHRSGVGQPHRQLHFSQNTSTKFNYWNSCLSEYLITPENAKFFQVSRPYTELQFGNSLNSDYQVNTIHSQNILPNWNAGFEYNLIGAEGTYINSSVRNHSLSATTNFFSKDLRYNLLAGITWNNYKIGEYGGIMGDTLFTQNIQTNRSAIPVYSPLASNQFIDLNMFASQSFRLAKVDSSSKASTFNIGKITHEIHYAKTQRTYFDSAGNTFYENQYFDTLFTEDAFGTKTLNNTVFWSNDIHQDAVYRNPFKIYAGINHELIQTTDALHFNKYNQLTFLGRARISPVKYITLTPYIEQVFSSNYSNGDYKYKASLDFDLSETQFPLISLFELELSARKPDYIFLQYTSNHYQWNETPNEKTNTFKANADFTYKSFNIGVTYHSIKDFYYFGQNITPSVYNDNLNIFQTSFNFNIDFFDLIYLNSSSAVQTTNKNSIVSVPLFYTKNSFFFDFWAFKKSLHLQTGTDIYYNTKYKAQAYSPDLAAFYVQRTQEFGNNLWADIFITAQIKRATIFIKFAHVNSMFINNPDYMMMPHYPTSDFLFKWGFIWKFFD